MDEDLVDSALRDATRVTAGGAWFRLPLGRQVAVKKAGVDPRDWTDGFAWRLHQRELTARPTSVAEASARMAAMSPATVDGLAVRYTDQLLRDPFLDPVVGFRSLLASPYAFRDADASSGEATAEGPRSDRRDHSTAFDDSTPFDGLIDGIWNVVGDNDTLRLGSIRVRLVGALALVALAVMIALSWVPSTLANTYRLVVLREFGWATLAKALIGWAGIVLVVAALLGGSGTQSPR
jgi:hypothetical protein